MESAVVGGLVAQEQRELFFIVFGERGILEPKGAAGESVMRGHFVDQNIFGWSGGLMLAAERSV